MRESPRKNCVQKRQESIGKGEREREKKKEQEREEKDGDICNKCCCMMLVQTVDPPHSGKKAINLCRQGKLEK